MNQGRGSPHDTDVVPTREEVWRARCRCGWRGELREWEHEALKDAAEHREEVEG